ncbi:unnamed protein product [Paramecium sonneborni]|uniref:Uncharacterized protein n=1 Tax=Paramecium sonneborni TaxID=65129 RepID=A0A8S1PUI1_9CILI|nr:unnamed protein product [Paramecium sonneborni]
MQKYGKRFKGIIIPVPKIKGELILIQQDVKLPDYCKFSLINNMETFKRMNRSNQEIKKTCLLFNMKGQFPSEKLKIFMENIKRQIKNYYFLLMVLVGNYEQQVLNTYEVERILQMWLTELDDYKL